MNRSIADFNVYYIYIYIMAEGNPRSIQALKDKIEFYEGLKVGGKLNVRGEQILHELRTKLAVEEGSGAGGGAGGAAAAPHIPMAPVGAYAGSTRGCLIRTRVEF